MKNNFSRRQGTAEGDASHEPDAGFISPDNSYAPGMFWFWNDSANITQPGFYAGMAAEICDKGINPGFIHARKFDPQTPFWLSEDWYKCFGAALDATEKRGMHISYTMGDPSFPDKYLLADHHDFPNFEVGGIELTDHPELRAVSLDCRVVDVTGDAPVELPDAFFAVAARVAEDGRVLSCTLNIISDETTNGTWQPPEAANWRIFIFSKIYDFPSQYKVNFLNRELAGPWLELENTKYETLFKKSFGSTMQGVFFDLEGFFGYRLAWSDDLSENYRQHFGADIRERMPLLLEEDFEGIWPKARHDWFAAVGSVYGECVIDPMENWCRQRGMYQTCHFWEESLLLQSTRMGDYMGMQRRLSMPGTDALFDTIHEPRYFKEVQSVCEFEGRQLMCEALGIAGWHLTPVDIRKSVNSAIAMGITRFILHGVNSNRNPAETSYPPDFFDWNPYWRYFRMFGDYTRRASYVNDHGRLDAEVLLFCPLNSVNALVGDGFFDLSYDIKVNCDETGSYPLRHLETLKKIETGYSNTIRQLYEARIDYCVADRHYFEQMNENHGTLECGDFRFRTVILPPLKIIDIETAGKLVVFAENGGTVYALGELPDASTCRGTGDETLSALMDCLRESVNFIAATDGIGKHIQIDRNKLPACVEFTDGSFPLIASRRKVGNRSFFWLANNENINHKFSLRLRGVSGGAELWNCENGAKREIPVRQLAADIYDLDIELASGEGAWLIFDPEKKATVKTPHPEETGELALSIEGGWEISIDADDQPTPVLQDYKIPGHLINGLKVDKLESWINWGLETFSGYVDYRKNIEIDAVSGNEELDLGEVKYTAEVWVNGVSAGARIWPPYTFKIGNFLKAGNNEIKIKVGNIILNGLSGIEGYNWRFYNAPSKEQLQCGLTGPVRIVAVECAAAHSAINIRNMERQLVDADA